MVSKSGGKVCRHKFLFKEEEKSDVHLLKKKFRAFRCIEFLKKIQISGRLCKKKKRETEKY